MATRTWTGSTDGDLNTAGNWTSGVPGAGDVALVPFNATVNIDASMSSIAAMQAFIVEKGCRIKIGGNANELTTSLTVDGLRYEGEGEMWFKDSAGTTTRAIIAATKRGSIISLGGDTITKILIQRGNVTLAGDLGNVTLLEVGYRTDRANDVILEMIASGNTVTKLIQHGGLVKNSAQAVTLLEMKGGVYKHNTSSGIVLTECNMDGGSVEYIGSGTIVDLRMHGGTFEIKGSAMTLTNLWKYPGSWKFIRNTNANVHAVTNTFDQRDAA